jgi:MinD-like ATPase involved in chromosome partitioning or flagellar assembly
MNTNFLKNIFKKKTEIVETSKIVNRANTDEMEKSYNNDDFVHSALILKILLEVYGERKKKNHRQKGREFIQFILSNKHKDLKTIGYTHWQNINKIIQTKHTKVYPYHKNNLRNAIDFFTKEVRSINSINVNIN